VSLAFDRQLFEDDVTAAWLGRRRSPAPGCCRRPRCGCRGRTARDPRPGPPRSRLCQRADEDIHAFVERQLVERVGEAGKRLHTGRSRNEQVSLDLRLYLKRRVRSSLDG